MTRHRARACAVACAGVAALVASWIDLIPSAARGQSVDVERAQTLVVGAPPGARADRVDAARTGLVRGTLPTTNLHVEWRASAGSLLEETPLVDAHGNAYVVGARGEAVVFARNGTELWRVPTGIVDPGPGALLSDDTFVIVDPAGEAVAVREGTVRWRRRFGAGDVARPAPLPLDDGGVVVATAQDLAVLDAQGRQRARVSLPEATSAPLLSALGQIIVVTAPGTVWGWVPGALEPTRLGAFGSRIEGSAALADSHTLVAVAADRTTLAAVDLLHGAAASTVRAVAQPGAFWLGSPALRGEVATVAMLGPASELAVTIDAEGHEVHRALLSARVPFTYRADGGALPTSVGAGLRAPLLVDAAGDVAFAALDGSVGVATMGASNGESVELLSDVCPHVPGASSSTMPVVGIAPLPTGGILVACRSGTVLAVASSPGNLRSGKR